MAGIQKWVVTEPYLDIPGELLEGPFGDEARNEFRFIDILAQKLYIVDLAKGPESLTTIDTVASIGVTANVADDGEAYKTKIIAGAKQGFALVDRLTGEMTWLRKVWNEDSEPGKAQRMRFNDGAVDRHGRFWAGAMNDPKVVPELTDEGVLFRLDPDLSVHRMVEKMTIPNGIGWNDADDTMFLTDSTTGTIFAYDYDADTGNISNRRAHFRLDAPLAPDGFAIDVEGCIWTAVWGGGKVLRLSPEGKVIGEICLPTRNITCPAFVGTALFITSAADDGSASAQDEMPDSVRYGGRVFKVDVGVRGQPKNAFHFRE